MRRIFRRCRRLPAKHDDGADDVDVDVDVGPVLAALRVESRPEVLERVETLLAEYHAECARAVDILSARTADPVPFGAMRRQENEDAFLSRRKPLRQLCADVMCVLRGAPP